MRFALNFEKNSTAVAVGSGGEKALMLNCFENPGSIFFEIRRYFFKIAGNSADTAVNFLRTADRSGQ